jgi:glycerophosphoryl diester phosphodiesterase
MCFSNRRPSLDEKRPNLSIVRAIATLFAALVLSIAILRPAAGDSGSHDAAPSSTPRAGRIAKRIVVIAHRGAHREAPENTLASLAQAIEIGCDYVELDVRRTKDGALVIMHDASVNRMTSGKGKIADLTLKEIRKLDVKSRQGAKWAGQKIPTFDEMLERAKGRMKIYVDHKQAPPAEVLAAINRHGMLHDVVVYGRGDTLREYKRLAPDVWIMPGHPKSIAAIDALAHDLKPETLDGSIVEWTQPQVEAAHRNGAQVWVDNRSDLDNEAGIKRAVELGVDAIQTDDPATVLRLLRAMGLRGDAGK